ncbi:MAG TPA: hypothetical protein DD417_03855 [Elusimicrobia bacterium]|nr:hypothetical protein [Elusimicrobiota bacterium]
MITAPQFLNNLLRPGTQFHLAGGLSGLNRRGSWRYGTPRIPMVLHTQFFYGLDQAIVKLGIAVAQIPNHGINLQEQV